MQTSLAKQLHAEGLISDDSLQNVKTQEAEKLFSVHRELKTLLYLGVLLLSTGLGILVYKNIDTIGHQAVLAFIALVSAGCFYYCGRKQPPFSTVQVISRNPVADYLLLLACLSFVSFVGYWQYQYHIFGERYGLAFFIPFVVLIFSAYYFDHLGVLSLAITNLAAWAGIAITPLRILKDNDFDSPRLILTGIVLGVLLLAAAWAGKQWKTKAHFSFTYLNFGMNLLFISCLAGLCTVGHFYLLWFVLLAGVVAWFYGESMRRRSFYIVLMLSVYGYIGLGYTITRLLFSVNFDIGGLILDCMYFILSAIGLILFLVRIAKKMKQHDSIQ